MTERCVPDVPDVVVVGGVALALGGLFPFARAEVAMASVGVVAALAWARGAVVAGRAAVVVLVLVACGSLRASRMVDAHERLVEAAAQVIPRPARCAGMARVAASPVRVHGAMRWQGELREGTCDGPREGAGVPWSGRVTLFGGPEALARGDDVAVVADLGPPTRLWNTSDPRPAEARRGDVRSGGAVDARVVRRGTGVLAWVDRVRARARARIDATFAVDVAPMARALVLGESDLAPEDDAAMRASGLSHLLAVSGMHLVITVVTAVAVLRALLVRVEALGARVDVGRVASALGVPIAWVYAELAGGAGATKRAAWMLSVGFVARALGRRSDAWRAFGWSLVAMAAGDALSAFDVSFVLSAAAVAGLLGFARPAAAWAERAPALVRPVIRSASATVAASLACAPIIARFAPTLPLGGVLANLLAVPVGESIALPVCLVHAMLAPWPAAERGCALVAGGALRIVRTIARGFAAAPVLAIGVPPPTAWELVVLAVGTAAFALAPRGRRAPVALVAVAALLVAEVGVRHAGSPVGALRVTFLDVGQGDSALVDLPDGQAMLIDGGGLVGSPVDTGERVVAPVLRARRRGAVALAVLSHPHPDHFGGLPVGLASVRVGALWDSGQGEREGVAGGYATLLGALRARGVPVLRPAEICGPHVLGGAQVDVLAPCPEPSVDRGPNDNSLVVRIAYGSRAFLFVGDAEHEEEADLLRLAPARLRADVLKVGHHGSRTSSSPAFLAAVAPREAVISVGTRNRFGHPHPFALAALAASGARVWRTELEGAVTITTDGTSLAVDTARRNAYGGASSSAAPRSPRVDVPRVDVDGASF